MTDSVQIVSSDVFTAIAPDGAAQETTRDRRRPSVGKRPILSIVTKKCEPTPDVTRASAETPVEVQTMNPVRKSDLFAFQHPGWCGAVSFEPSIKGRLMKEGGDVTGVEFKLCSARNPNKGVILIVQGESHDLESIELGNPGELTGTFALNASTSLDPVVYATFTLDGSVPEFDMLWHAEMPNTRSAQFVCGKRVPGGGALEFALIVDTPADIATSETAEQPATELAPAMTNVEPEPESLAA